MEPADASKGRYVGILRYGRRALELVWVTSRPLTVAFALLTLVAGVLPAGAAYVGQLIVDAVVTAHAIRVARGELVVDEVLRMVALEGVLVIALAATQRAISVCQSLLRAQLGHRVNVMILEKALTLELVHFEDPQFYDKLTRARREASSRPLSLVNRTFGLIQHAISLTSYGALLWQFSPWAVAVLVVAGLPAFLVEAKFSGDAFRLFRWRSPETRKQSYLETVIAREDYAKEVKLFGLGPRLLQRYKDIFSNLFAEDRALTLRRGAWGFALGLIGTAAFYGTYAWVGYEAVAGIISLGEMTMYLMVFKQGQSAVSAGLQAIGGMYEDNLYLSTLYEYLEVEVPPARGDATKGPVQGDGIRFENVSFAYPGATEDAVQAIDLHLRAGEAVALVGENGSGKTTLIKLLARLYHPTTGRITLDGLDIEEWDPNVLRRKIGIIFQDFARYQMLVGENIGAGDEDRFDDASSWERAAKEGMAAPFIERLPQQYATPLGRWFADGQELSGGQWQKIALSRAFIRQDADVLVLDEPTAAMDARAEAEVFEHVRKLARHKMTVLISHRFSTVRMADHIIVLDRGRIVEQGSHPSLMEQGGRYAQLFALQAAGYR